jgi:hypothetical protein
MCHEKYCASALWHTVHAKNRPRTEHNSPGAVKKKKPISPEGIQWRSVQNVNDEELLVNA